MMPNRILKESIRESESIDACSLGARDLFIRLITYADDYGRFNVDLIILRARLYPRETEIIELQQIELWLGELIEQNMVAIYQNRTGLTEKVKLFGQIVHWNEHQRIRNSKPKHPEPTEHSWINDWALRRCVSLELKKLIYERDNFTCQQCGFQLSFPSGWATRQKLRALDGFLHVDHIVPVVQGGRATEENLRVLCASCNKHRPRRFNWNGNDLVAASCGELQPTAANGEPLRPESQSESNPIQSESYKESQSENQSNIDKVYDFWNTQNIKNHRKFTSKMERAINTAIKEYGFDVVITAISTYGEIIHSPNYYFEYRWGLVDFLKRGIEKFDDPDIAKNNYKKSGKQDSEEEKPLSFMWVKCKSCGELKQVPSSYAPILESGKERIKCIKCKEHRAFEHVNIDEFGD